MRDIVDQLAPLHVRCRTGGIAPWFDADIRSARRECRRLERRYLRTRTTDDRRRWVDAARRRSRLYLAKKESFWLDRLSQQGRYLLLCGGLCRPCLSTIVTCRAPPVILLMDSRRFSAGRLTTYEHLQPANRRLQATILHTQYCRPSARGRSLSCVASS